MIPFAPAHMALLGPLLVLLPVLVLLVGMFGSWLIWTGLERRPWWLLRFAVGGPVAGYAVAVLTAYFISA